MMLINNSSTSVLTRSFLFKKIKESYHDIDNILANTLSIIDIKDYCICITESFENHFILLVKGENIKVVDNNGFCAAALLPTKDMYKFLRCNPPCITTSYRRKMNLVIHNCTINSINNDEIYLSLIDFQNNAYFYDKQGKKLYLMDENKVQCSIDDYIIFSENNNPYRKKTFCYNNLGNLCFSDGYVVLSLLDNKYNTYYYNNNGLVLHDNMHNIYSDNESLYYDTCDISFMTWSELLCKVMKSITFKHYSTNSIKDYFAAHDNITFDLFDSAVIKDDLSFDMSCTCEIKSFSQSLDGIYINVENATNPNSVLKNYTIVHENQSSNTLYNA
ncbi:hypothetical protein [Ehrlichia canis]|uniref:Uncharacterized protein n=1 Tax=Ehrlichia canis (strain Jake) TaxID=269484 RepID=A0ACA6AVY2_EHRCJ|nr:hypothetical protein [Ehrlichia canis]AAZ68490.1 hypothetical protein Ecaj_0450 [Ehrlichia canis str. Jake]UKC53292.1 hypothetical protein s20019040002_000335 [Ehrlichia canis]UKC54229.1 hypothetical protein s20026770001_000335 [Ehrlichia canis]UKC55165.1 hypothetical protein s21009500007_000335 [Ehrlichia canis]